MAMVVATVVVMVVDAETDAHRPNMDADHGGVGCACAQHRQGKR